MSPKILKLKCLAEDLASKGNLPPWMPFIDHNTLPEHHFIMKEQKHYCSLTIFAQLVNQHSKWWPVLYFMMVDD